MIEMSGGLACASRSASARPIRILHVVDRMNRGGAETWLMQVLRHINRERFQLDFLATASEPGSFDEAISDCGSNVLGGPVGRKPWWRASCFQRVFEKYGRYDVVHSHLHHFSGAVLRSAAYAGIPVRIAHSHSDTSARERRANIGQTAYIRLMDRWIRQYATCGIAVSRAAAKSLFGPDWGTDSRKHVLYCGTDPSAFRGKSAFDADLRMEMKIPSRSRVYGYIGRFVEPKNHPFLIEILQRLAILDPAGIFVLAGDGPLFSSTQAAIERTGLSGRTRLLGARPDVPRLLSSLIDVLLLPSLWEGLPLVTIESQAAGVPCLCSEAVPEEAIEIPGLLRRIPLDVPADLWAREAMVAAMSRNSASRPGLSDTRFDIRVGVRHLEEIYEQCAGHLESR
jgi:glycosyltransferase involved in cell wall biosynthesis